METPAGATVIEIATFELADGMTAASFAPLDAAVAAEHVSQQPGFVARQSACADDGTWLAVVWWESSAAANASMASFADAPAAAGFMGGMKAETMAMKQYTLNA